MHRRLMATLLLAPFLLAGCTSSEAAVVAPTPPTPSSSAESAAPSASASSPAIAAPVGTRQAIRNVVVVLADDLDWKLWNDVPRLRALSAQGTTLTDYVVSDSLCCPSRSTLFRGQYVHNHQVISNDKNTGGGWVTFRDRGYPSDCLPTWLHDAGVHTGLIGKYLNGFPDTPAEATQVPPGWDTFVVPTSRVHEYRGYDYALDKNGQTSTYGHAPTDFLNDVLDQQATDFIAHSPDRFFLELATFTPHLPSPVAPRHRGSHAGEQAPRDPAFDAAVTNPPAWLAGLPSLSAQERAHLDRTWVRRAESAESVADSVDAVRTALQASGHTDDTLVVVTSDNGFHVGSYRAHRGKRTAFDVDTVVPTVLIGPGMAPGTRIDAVTSETDLGPTIADTLDVKTPGFVDGRSWLPIIDAHGGSVPWRTATVSESLSQPRPGDPDYQLIAPPTFTALRSPHWLFVESRTRERELYDRVTDPYELHNIIDTAPMSVVDQLHRQLVAMHECSAQSCRTADSLRELGVQATAALTNGP